MEDALGLVESKEEENAVSNTILETPENAEETVQEEASVETNTETDNSMAELNTYFEETRFEAKPSLWQRIKNSKFVRTLRYIMQIRIVLDYPALPEGKGDNY